MMIQAKRARDKMKAAGFKLGEMSVTTSKIARRCMHTGRKFYEYGDAAIVVWAPLEKRIELTQAMLAQGLDVCHFISAGKVKSVHITAGHPGGQFEVFDLGWYANDASLLRELHRHLRPV